MTVFHLEKYAGLMKLQQRENSEKKTQEMKISELIKLV